MLHIRLLNIKKIYATNKNKLSKEKNNIKKLKKNNSCITKI
jgi:hypothetical protein